MVLMGDNPAELHRLVSQAGGSSGLLMDLAANEKAVHSDFFNGKQPLFISFFRPMHPGCFI